LKKDEAKKARYVRVNQGRYQNCIGLTLRNAEPENQEDRLWSLVRVVNYPNTQAFFPIEWLDLIDWPPATTCYETVEQLADIGYKAATTHSSDNTED
jgi:hypothetical protein